MPCPTHNEHALPRWTLADTARLPASLDLRSVDTNNSDRARHLTSGDFSTQKPTTQMMFVSRSATEGKLVSGLTINGTTKTVVTDVDYQRAAIDNYDMTPAGFSATSIIRRSDSGINFNASLAMDGNLVRDTVAI